MKYLLDKVLPILLLLSIGIPENDLFANSLDESMIRINVFDTSPLVYNEPNGNLQFTVQGQVNDLTTGEALPGVNIIVKGTAIGTATDLSGAYELSVPSLSDTLVFSYIGYEEQEIPIDERSSIDVTLVQEMVGGEELIVVGYGVLSTRQLSSSVSSISADNLANEPVSQFSQSLQGKIAGVQITQTDGMPGSGMNIKVRGAASITAGSDPLYVIDGAPVVGGINHLNSHEIESISVLKDAAATALYGSRAANGVVLIETRQAVAGEMQVNYNGYAGFQQVPQRGRPDMMNAREFATFRKEIAEFNNQEVNEVYQNPEQYGEGTDWYDAITRTAPIQDHNLTMSTGTESFSTTATAGYLHQDGVIVGSGYKRYSLRVNSRFQPFDALSIGLNVAPIYVENSNSGVSGVGNIINETLQTSPLAPLRNPDGSLTLTAFSPGMFPTPNYVRSQKDRIVDNSNTQTLANLFLDFEVIPGVVLRTSGNIDRGDSRSFNFNGTTTGTRGVGLYDIPFSSLNEGSYLSWVNENTLNYQSDIGNHSFDALIGFTAQHYRNDHSTINADNYPDDKVTTIGAAGSVSATSNVQEWGLVSYLARINYNFQNKYLLSASLRRDGSSRFGQNNRWGNFPSLSIGWVVSEEEFMPAIREISFLKIRSSYGITGNFNIGNYSHIPTISTANYVFGNSIASGRSVSNLADQNLGWETNEQINTGVDLNLFDDRLELTYDYYIKNTRDLLFNVRVRRASGFSNIQTNIGEVKFWGHEIGLRSNNIVASTMSWSTNFNISFTRNRVESMGTSTSSLITGPGSGLIGGSHLTIEGEPIGMLYGMIHEGVYVDQADFDSSPKHSTSQVGTAKFRDVNGDGVITVDDATIIGNPHPDFTFGMTNYVNYKNIDLSISIFGTYGNEIIRGSEQTLANLDGVFNVLADIENRWRSPEDPGNGRYGSLAAGTTYLERDWWGTQMLYDGSHISINNITLGYTIPLESASYLRNVRVYASVQQAHIFTSYPGANPQVSQSQASTGLGIDGGSYPVPRTVSLGLNIGF